MVRRPNRGVSPSSLLCVRMWGTTIGFLSQPSAGAAHFQYDEDFLDSGIQISPLTMPLSSKTYSFPALPENTYKGLPGLVADSLPDKFGSELLSTFLAQRGQVIDDLSSVERLSYSGKRGMGALEYEPSKDIAPEAQNASINELGKLAEAILAKKEAVSYRDQAGLISLLMESSSSVGGARAKTLVALNPVTGQVRSGKVDAGEGFEYWLLKFGNVANNADKDIQPDDPGYTRIEYAYYLMAKAAGLEMTECKLRVEDGCAHFMTKRFDRVQHTGEKMHMQTLCALAHMDFNSPRVYSYEEAFAVIRRLRLSYQESLQLFKRMLFNDIAYNFDDHTKNISFLMDKTGQWMLAPAYDITFSFKRSSKWVSAHQMLINGKSRNITDEDYFAVAKNVGIRKSDAKSSIEQVKESIQGWCKYAEEAGLAEEKAQAIGAELRAEL